MFIKRLLFNQAGGLGDAGGGGAGGDSGTPSSGTPSEFVGPSWAKDLKLDVPEDILKDPALGPISDLNGLVKSYVHGQRMIGQKSFTVPTENSTREEWDSFYQKIGIPLKEEDYNKGLKLEGMDEELNKQYLKTAHELRISPKQAQSLHKFFADNATAAQKRSVESYNAEVEQGLQALEEKLGKDAYAVNLAKTNRFIKEHASPEFLQYLAESGIGRNAKVVEGLMNMALKFTKESPQPDGTGGTYGMTKDDYQREINKAMGDFNDPYHKPGHPDHSRRVNEIQKYFQKIS